MTIITQEQIAKVNAILTQLDEPGPVGGLENRRRSSRVQIRTRLTVTLLNVAEPAEFSVYTRNISLSGLGFVCRRVFLAGDRVAISLRIPKVATRLLLARITFGRYIRAGLYEMGCEFLECVNAPEGEAHIPQHWHIKKVKPSA